MLVWHIQDNLFPSLTECWMQISCDLSSDAPVHPPVSETHPYDNQDPKSMPGDTEYGCKMVGGVVHVYTKKTNMDKYVCYRTRQ